MMSIERCDHRTIKNSMSKNNSAESVTVLVQCWRELEALQPLNDAV